jgi:hypothetical protein
MPRIPFRSLGDSIASAGRRIRRWVATANAYAGMFVPTGMRLPRFHLEGSNASTRYVAFLDVLGFGQRVRTDFAAAVEFYNEALGMATQLIHAGMFTDLTVRVLSDSIVVTGTRLVEVVETVRGLQFGAFANDCLLRGGIALGKHVEDATRGNLFVVSEPLLAAARLEKAIGVPAVGFDDSILPPPGSWGPLAQSNLQRSVLYFEGRWVVNPFNIMWYRSAGDRVRQMLDRFPEQKEKFQWFLRLHEAAWKQHLVPTPQEWESMVASRSPGAPPKLTPPDLEHPNVLK